MSGFPSPGIARGGKTRKIQEFLTSGNWILPAGVETVDIFLVGGGAGTYATISGDDYSAVGGGGGGNVIKKIISVSSDLVVTIPAGGLGGQTSNAPGGDGGTGSIIGTGVNVQAGGGNSGIGDAPRSGSGLSSVTNSGGSGAGGGAGGSAIAIGGTTSHDTLTYNLPATVPGSGHGGLSAMYNYEKPTGVDFAGPGVDGYGGGGAGSRSAITVDGGATEGQSAANNTGGGGGGRYSISQVTVIGSNGGSGYALITWFE